MAASRNLTRREVLRLAIASGTLVMLPLRLRATVAAPALDAPFLDADEFALVDAITARIVPTDSLPGAHEAGVAHYIQGLLSALPAADGNCDRRTTAADLVALTQQLGAPTASDCPDADADGDTEISSDDVAAALFSLFERKPIYAGGPFSGRTPFGDFANGIATDQSPGNSFQSSIPLNRVQRLAWKVRLDGANAVPEVANNPLAQSLLEVDLRRRYRDGLSAIDTAAQATFAASFVALTAAQQDQILAAADPEFVNLITGHTVEGLFCAPEYGGNRNQVGWQLIGFDGDSQPLGYTLGFDLESQTYIERADKPNSLPDPDETCAGFSSSVQRFLGLISLTEDTQPAMRFRSPFCFGVE